MEKITQIDIEQATKRYAEALTSDMLAKKRAEKNKIELIKTHNEVVHNEVVMAFQDLHALRFQN